MPVCVDEATGQLVVQGMTFGTLQDMVDFCDAADSEYGLTGSIEGTVGEYLSTGRMSDGIEDEG
jgi:hypothetical protein